MSEWNGVNELGSVFTPLKEVWIFAAREELKLQQKNKTIISRLQKMGELEVKNN